MRIGFFYNKSQKITGCQKVGLDTLRGLRELGVDVRENQLGDMNGCVHGTPEFRNMTLPPKTLIGPCIVVLPTENKGMYSTWQHFVHPCKWVFDYMQTFPLAQNARHYYWPVGIDTERFNDKLRGHFEYDCLVYYKNVTKQTPDSKLGTVERELEKRKLSYKVIRYGSYTENQMKHLAAVCKFCIFLAGTESQNIAIMEMMSMGIPIYVLDCKVMEYQSFRYESEHVSSAPYFSEECGVKVNGMDFDKFDQFWRNYHRFKPRNYILENHTLKKGAEKYLNILKEVNGV